MKKFIALTIGLSIMGSAMLISMSDASREAYHSYLYNKAKQSKRYKRFSDRQANQKQVLVPKKNVSVRTSLNSKARRNFLYADTSKRNLFNSKSTNSNLKQRTVSNRVLGTKMGYGKSSSRMAISTSKNLDVTDFSFENFSNELFSVEIPAKSNADTTKTELNQLISMSSIKVIAKKLDTKCNAPSFEVCSKNISKMIDRKSDLYRNSKTIQEYMAEADSILGSVELDKSKHMEGFIAVNKGVTSFVARFFVEGKDGDIFMLEANSNLKDIDKTVIIAKRLFETFRAKY